MAAHPHSRLRDAHATMFGLAHHANHYDWFSGRLGAPLYRRVADDVAEKRLPPGAVVLDVGTGPGRVPRLIHERCPELVVEGIDLSPEMIERAEEATIAEGGQSDRLSYAVADVAQLPHADASVDLVVSTISLHHWADVPAGLSEIRRVLKPGGTAWIYDIRRVLNHATATANARGIPATVQPLRPRRPRSLGGRIASVFTRLMARLQIEA